MDYLELKNQHSNELNDFNMFFAFNDKQFEEGIKKFGITKLDKGVLIRIPGGGFIKKTDKEAFLAMFERHNIEMKSAMKDRKFLIGAISYELSNHEYTYTMDYQPALEALGVELDNDMQKECLAEAKKIAWSS